MINRVEIAGNVAMPQYVDNEGNERLTFGIAEDYRFYSQDGDRKDGNGRTFSQKTRWHNFVAFGVVAKALYSRVSKAKSVFVISSLTYTERTIGDIKVKEPSLKIRLIDHVTILEWKTRETECPKCAHHFLPERVAQAPESNQEEEGIDPSKDL